MDCIYSVASNSSSVTFGNIAQHTREFVKNIFPADFFNYEHISSEIAYRNIRRQLGANTRKSLAKRNKPYLIIRPIIQVPTDTYLYGTPLTSNMDHIHNVLDTRAMIPIIQDTDEGLRLSFKLNRDRMEFRVTVIVSTWVQQIDTYKLLTNVAMWGRTQSRRLPMEFMIPRPIISALANRQHMDISKEVYAADIFLEYLNKHSRYPITYKMRNSTAKDEYFMYSTQDVLFTLDELEITEGSLKNMANDTFEISFNVEVEFNQPGLYVLCGDEKLKEKTMSDIILAEATDGTLNFPLFTIDNLFAYNELDNGFKKFKSSILALEPDSITKDDVTDFSPLLGQAFTDVIRYYTSLNIPIDTIAIMQLYKNNELLSEGEEYDIDWYKTKLVIHNPDIECSYRMILYINSVKVNELLIEYQDSIASDKPKLTKN